MKNEEIIYISISTSVEEQNVVSLPVEIMRLLPLSWNQNKTKTNKKKTTNSKQSEEITYAYNRRICQLQ